MPSKQKNDASDRPFSPKVLAMAKQAVDDYRFAFWREDGRYVGQCMELDTLGIGNNPDECISEAKALAVTAIAFLLESGKRLPLPARNQARTVQVNIRLSPDEKRAIEDAASKGGFRGISDYLRIRGLAFI